MILRDSLFIQTFTNRENLRNFKSKQKFKKTTSPNFGTNPCYRTASKSAVNGSFQSSTLWFGLHSIPKASGTFGECSGSQIS